MTRDQILERYLERGYKQVFYSDLPKVLIQTCEGGPYIENRSDLIYFQSMYIVSYYKGDSEYKFKLFIRIKYIRNNTCLQYYYRNVCELRRI